MGYIIVSKNESDGRIGNDSSSLNVYFELGWEMVTTHFLVKRLFNEKKITNDDIIVTQKDRMFIYQSVFDNVISYDDFKNKKDSLPILDLISVVRQPNYIFFKQYYTEIEDENRKYIYFDADRELNTNFKKCEVLHLHKNKKYICLAIRKRDHDKYRNMEDQWAVGLIKELKKYVDTIFIVGKDAEDFCDKINIIHVSLQEFATLCNNELCVANIGTLSGIMFIPMIFSNSKYNVIIDVGGQDELKNGYKYGNPLLMAKCVRYSNSTFVELDKKNISYEEILNKINLDEA